MRPLLSVPAKADLPWFTSTQVGQNELNKMVQRMCQEAGVAGKKTNHSLRATGASQLFQANVPEKIIQQRTGHRSLQALRHYERTTSERHQASHPSSDVAVSYQSIVEKQITPQPMLPMATTTAAAPVGPAFNMSCTVKIYYNPDPVPPPLLPEITKAALDYLLEDLPTV